MLLESKPGDLSLAWKPLAARSKDWTQRFNRGLERLTKDYPATGKELLRRFSAARAARSKK